MAREQPQSGRVTGNPEVIHLNVTGFSATWMDPWRRRCYLPWACSLLRTPLSESSFCPASASLPAAVRRW